MVINTTVQQASVFVNIIHFHTKLLITSKEGAYISLSVRPLTVEEVDAAPNTLAYFTTEYITGMQFF